MDGLFRRSVLDLFLGRPEAAMEGFGTVENIALELGHDRFVRLACVGRAAALDKLGQRTEATRLAESLAVDPKDLSGILERETLLLLI